MKKKINANAIKMRTINVCRICLIEDTGGRRNKPMQPLFENRDIVQKIEECGGISLRPHEGFPKMICYQCLDQLNVSYKFRAMCQASESALLDAIVKTEKASGESETGETSVNTVPAQGADVAVDNSFLIEFPAEEYIEQDFETESMIQEDTEGGAIDGGGESMEEEHLESIEQFNENDDQDQQDEEEYKHCFMPSDDEYIPSEEEDIKPEPVVGGRRGRKPTSAAKKFVAKNSKRSKKRSNKKFIKQEIKGEPGIPAVTMCEICGNIYSKPSQLNTHMRRHMTQKPFDCEICGKTFACPSEITRHMRTHTGEKPYECKYCGRTFADRSTNIKHERIHTNTRPFQCTTCGKSFTYSNVLKNHMLTHTGEKPFNCAPCNKTFSRKHQLEQHFATITHQQTVKSLNAASSGVVDESEALAHQIMQTEQVEEVEA